MMLSSVVGVLFGSLSQTRARCFLLLPRTALNAASYSDNDRVKIIARARITSKRVKCKISGFDTVSIHNCFKVSRVISPESAECHATRKHRSPIGRVPSNSLLRVFSLDFALGSVPSGVHLTLPRTSNSSRIPVFFAEPRPGDNLVWPDSKKAGADGWGPEAEEVFEIREIWPEESPKLNRLMQDMSMSFSFEY